MAYSSKTTYCSEDVHHLLGATLRDNRQVREGRVVGIDQSHASPIVHILWAGERAVERVAMSVQQLEQLMAACSARHADRRDDVAQQRLKAHALQSVDAQSAQPSETLLRRQA